MCIYKFKNSDKCKMINRNKLGNALRSVLDQTKLEKRLLCGLLPAISHLEATPEDVLLCLLSQSRPGDAATHMQTVLLQAFCYENDIPVIQVDSAEKLGEMCGLKKECPCAVVSRGGEPPSPSEQELADFYECTLEEFPRPVVELPR